MATKHFYIRSNFFDRLSQHAKEWFPAMMVSISVLILWHVFIVAFDIPRYVLPKPSAVAGEIGTRADTLLYHLGWTMGEAIGGFLIGSGLALLVAILFVHSRLLERSMYPWAVVLQTVPIVAIAPLLTIWMGFGILSKMVISAIICFFPMLVNALRGLRSVSPQALELMQILSASKSDILFRLRLPSALPYLFTGLKVTSTLSVVGAIVGEFTGADFGIGKVILVASYQQDTQLLFAALVYSSAGAIVAFLLVTVIEKLVIRWQIET